MPCLLTKGLDELLLLGENLLGTLPKLVIELFLAILLRMPLRTLTVAHARGAESFLPPLVSVGLA